MTTVSRAVLALLFAGGIALGAAGCSSDGASCEKAVDHAFSLMADEMGGEMAEGLEEEKANTVEECKEELEENPEETQKGLDCMAGASSMEELQECDDF